MAGQQTYVAIDAGGGLVVIARAKMNVTLNALRLASHDDADLRVSLQPFDSVKNLHAGSLQRTRALNISLLVEPRLELDENRHVFSVLSGSGQRRDDRTVSAGSVEGLFNSEHVGIVGRLLDQLHDRVKAVIRVEKKHVPPRDCLKDIFQRVDIGGLHRQPGLVAVLVSAARFGQLHDRGQVERPVAAVDIPIRNPQ